MRAVNASDVHISLAQSIIQGTTTLEIPGTAVLTPSASAVDLRCRGGGASPLTPVALLLRSSVTINATNCTSTPRVSNNIVSLYLDRWVAENVIEDITAMNALIQSSSTPEAIHNKAQQELAITLPEDTDTITQNALCGNGKTYWKSLKNSPTQAVCQSSDILAMADFTDTVGGGGGKMWYASTSVGTSPQEPTSPSISWKQPGGSGNSSYITDNGWLG